MLKLPSFDDLKIHLHPSGFSASIPAADPTPRRPQSKPRPRPAGLGSYLGRVLGALVASRVAVVLGAAVLLHGIGAGEPVQAATPAVTASPALAAPAREARGDCARPGAGRTQVKPPQPAAPAGRQARPAPAAPPSDATDEPWRHQGVGFGAPAPGQAPLA